MFQSVFWDHLFYFLDVKYPETSGKKYLFTPSWLLSLFPPSGMGGGGGVHGYTMNQRQQGPQAGPPPGNNLFGGQGRRLGN